MSLSANSNIYVRSQLALIDCLSLQYVCLVIFDLMPDNVIYLVGCWIFL